MLAVEEAKIDLDNRLSAQLAENDKLHQNQIKLERQFQKLQIEHMATFTDLVKVREERTSL